MTKTRRAPALKVALAGAGMISWYHLTAWRNLGERVELIAVCDPDEGKARSRAQEFGIAKIYAERDAMLAGEAIDALDVATPRETHAGWVEAAAMRGIDVLCQKPLTPTLAEAQELVLRLGGKIRLMVHENWRFRPWYRELKRWIATACSGISCLDAWRWSIPASCRTPGANARPSCANPSCSTRSAADDGGGADPSSRCHALPLRRVARRHCARRAHAAGR